MAMFKPMLACNADLDKIQYPVIVQPKIDGVRALVINEQVVGRSLKPFRNKKLQETWGKPEYEGLDGELFVGNILDPDLCRKTTSVVNSFANEADVEFCVFDTINLGLGKTYVDRFSYLCTKFHDIALTETVFVDNLEDLLAYETHFLTLGFEGIVIRQPNSTYKYGRSTMGLQELLKLKRFTDAEAVVVDVLEGHHNQNEAVINNLGLVERSSHKENMIGNSQIGTLVCKDLKTRKLIHISPGRMTLDERLYYFQNQSDILDKIIKYKCFEKGKKDKPRFPTFQCFRAIEDMGGGGA